MNFFRDRYREKGFAFGDEHSSVVEEAMAFITSEQNINVLELGVGEGRDALYLANCGFRMTGVDIVEEGLKKLKKMSENKKLNVKTVQEDITDFDIQRNNYVAIFSIMTLQFIVPQNKRKLLIKKIKNGLTENGIACLKVKTMEDPQYREDMNQPTVEEKTFLSSLYNCNVYYFEPNELLNLFYDMHIRLYREYKYLDKTHGALHYHGVAEIVAEKTKVSSGI